MITRVLERVIYRSRTYCVYTHDPAAQGDGRRDERMEVYDASAPPPAEVVGLYRRYAGRMNGAVMLARLRGGLATMLALRENADLLAYGWLQTWGPMRREFWWLAEDGICIGPDWTHPDARGRGIFGRILAHSIFESQQRYPGRPMYVWARAENDASNKGIRKAGFKPLGTHRVVTILGGLRRRHEQMPN